MFKNIMKYKVYALCTLIAVIFTWAGFKAGYHSGRKDASPMGVFFMKINNDNLDDAVVLDNTGTKRVYTCAFKGDEIVCERPIGNIANEYDKVLNGK